MFEDTKIRERVTVSTFTERISKIKSEDIEDTKHTFFRLSEKQRAIYTLDELRRIIIQEKPFLVGIQYNECYAVFYRYKGKVLKIIVVFNTSTKLNIVTFYFIKEEQIPKI